MFQECRRDMFLGVRVQEGVGIEGPYNTGDAYLRKVDIEGKEKPYVATMHANNFGQAMLKILVTFINQEKQGIE